MIFVNPLNTLICDAADPHLLAAVHIECNAYGIVYQAVFYGSDIHLDVVESLLFEIVLDNSGGGRYHILGKFTATLEIEFLLEIVLFAFLNAMIYPGRYPGALLDIDSEPHGVASLIDGVDIYAHVAELFLIENRAQLCTYLFSRDSDALTRLQAYHSHDTSGIEVLVTSDPNATNHISLRLAVVDGYVAATALLLSKHQERRHDQSQ